MRKNFPFSIKSIFKENNMNWPNNKLSYWMSCYLKIIKISKLRASISKNMTKMVCHSLKKPNINISWQLETKELWIALIMYLKILHPFLILIWNPVKLLAKLSKFKMLWTFKGKKMHTRNYKTTSSLNLFNRKFKQIKNKRNRKNKSRKKLFQKQ